MKPKSDAILQALEDSRQDEALITVGGSPLTAIREVQADGSDLLIGDMKIEPSDARARGFTTEYSREGEDDSPSTAANTAEPGEDETEWNIGFWLAPTHHGKGIMTDAVHTLIHDWAIPRMKARRFICGAFTGNQASVRVFEKNGFKTRSIKEDALEVRGQKRGIHILEWRSDRQ
ncbi:hypothetical protein EST38_g9551 [Candolleomyces aberdarensis]|uniref:N-acetyltransferase domain-containing protein n=1 Tax=Candolleomyces aberdarensis TaxID=2316362 RepID=A0A4Q2D9L9_9AGAR|nr:hypothetical protein EST38_g9551 [Candolleomyces aberdarensis]